MGHAAAVQPYSGQRNRPFQGSLLAYLSHDILFLFGKTSLPGTPRCKAHEVQIYVFLKILAPGEAGEKPCFYLESARGNRIIPQTASPPACAPFPLAAKRRPRRLRTRKRKRKPCPALALADTTGNLGASLRNRPRAASFPCKHHSRAGGSFTSHAKNGKQQASKLPPPSPETRKRRYWAGYSAGYQLNPTPLRL